MHGNSADKNSMSATDNYFMKAQRVALKYKMEEVASGNHTICIYMKQNDFDKVFFFLIEFEIGFADGVTYSKRGV